MEHASIYRHDSQPEPATPEYLKEGTDERPTMWLHPDYTRFSGEDTTIDLHYYCDRFRHVFTLTNWATFAPAVAPTGESGLYRPCFTQDNC